MRLSATNEAATNTKPPQEKAVSAPLLPSAASAPEAAACSAASPSQKLARMKTVGLASTFSVRLAAPVRNELFSKYIDEEDGVTNNPYY